MTEQVMRVCGHPGCQEWTPKDGPPRCRAHLAQWKAERVAHMRASHEGREKRSRRDNREFYGSQAWRDFRAGFIRRHPLCAQCGQAATQVHHLEPISERPDLAFDESNLSPTCARCHAREHARPVRPIDMWDDQGNPLSAKDSAGRRRSALRVARRSRWDDIAGLM